MPNVNNLRVDRQAILNRHYKLVFVRLGTWQLPPDHERNPEQYIDQVIRHLPIQ